MSGVKTRSTTRMMGRLFLVFSLGLPVFYSGTLALADDRGHISDHRVADRHVRHYYRNGHWYRPGWFGFGVAVPTLSTGVYVDTLPSTYTPVIVQGTTYYYGDNTYFSALPQGGYTVVNVSAH